MKECFVVLIVTVFVGGMFVALTPSGAFQKYMRFLCGIAVCGCVMMPFLSGEYFEKIDMEALENYWQEEQNKASNYDEIYNLSLKSAGIKNAEKYLKALIIKELNAVEDDFDISVIADNSSDEICIEHIEVTIYPSGVYLDPRKMQNIVYELLECECIIIYGWC